MSIRSALAKLSAAAAGGALIGGAAHVAEPQAATTSYKSVKAQPVKSVKSQSRPVPRRPEPRIARVIPPEPEQEYAMVPIPMPMPQQQPAPAMTCCGGGSSTPIVIGGSSGWGGGQRQREPDDDDNDLGFDQQRDRHRHRRQRQLDLDFHLVELGYDHQHDDIVELGQRLDQHFVLRQHHLEHVEQLVHVELDQFLDLELDEFVDFELDQRRHLGVPQVLVHLGRIDRFDFGHPGARAVDGPAVRRRRRGGVLAAPQEGCPRGLTGQFMPPAGSFGGRRHELYGFGANCRAPFTTRANTEAE